MREIKFRAWDKLSKLMRYGAEYQLSVIFPFEKDFELMQYTGLKDEKRTVQYPEGQEIYEGDIIKQGFKESGCGWFAPGVVEFKHGAWMRGNVRIFVEQDRADYKGSVSNNKWEVISNIYENPELIKNE